MKILTISFAAIIGLFGIIEVKSSASSENSGVQGSTDYTSDVQELFHVGYQNGKFRLNVLGNVYEIENPLNSVFGGIIPEEKNVEDGSNKNTRSGGVNVNSQTPSIKPHHKLLDPNGLKTISDTSAVPEPHNSYPYFPSQIAVPSLPSYQSNPASIFPLYSPYPTQSTNYTNNSVFPDYNSKLFTNNNNNINQNTESVGEYKNNEFNLSPNQDKGTSQIDIPNQNSNGEAVKQNMNSYNQIDNIVKNSNHESNENLSDTFINEVFKNSSQENYKHVHKRSKEYINQKNKQFSGHSSPHFSRKSINLNKKKPSKDDNKKNNLPSIITEKDGRNAFSINSMHSNKNHMKKVANVTDNYNRKNKVKNIQQKSH